MQVHQYLGRGRMNLLALVHIAEDLFHLRAADESGKKEVFDTVRRDLVKVLQ